MADRLLIQGGFLLTQDSALGELAADVLVVDGTIAAVGPDIEAGPGTEVVDATGTVVIPGFVDTHRHLWETTVRGASAWLDWDGYARVVRSEIGTRVRPEDAYAGNLLGALGALDSGVTTVRDESHVQNSPEHSDAALQGLVDAGGRAVFAYGWPSVDTYAWRAQDDYRRHPRYIEELLAAGDSRNGGLVTFALMVRGPELSGMGASREDLAFARELGLRSSMHVGNGEMGRQHHGIAALGEAGLLGPDLLFIHCCTSTPDELRMIADSGGTASVSAYIELAMPGLGSPATSRLLDAGVRPSFSIDAEPSAPADMFAVMRAALLAQTAEQVYTGAVPHTFDERDVLSFATLQGARACGLDDRIGSITPGKVADLVLVDVTRATTSSSVSAVSAVVNHGHAGAVTDVLVGGRFVKRHGELVRADVLRTAVATADASRAHLIPGPTLTTPPTASTAAHHHCGGQP